MLLLRCAGVWVRLCLVESLLKDSLDPPDTVGEGCFAGGTF